MALASALTAPGSCADLVLRGGAVYTMDAARSWAESVAVDEGRIVYVGDRPGVDRHIGRSTRVIDLDGRMVLPGFHDSHVHPVSGGIEMAQCNLNGAKDAREVAERVSRWAAGHPEAPWVVGGGWDLPLFPAANPSRQELDALVSDRPALLSAADGHSAWVNSAALRLAGITKATQDPPGGRIERDPATGEPSGTLRESAVDLVARHLPPTTGREAEAGLQRALEMAASLGITSLLEASADERILGAYLEMARRGGLTARVLAALEVDTGRGPEQVTGLIELRRRARREGGGLVRASAAKIFVDGVIESRTAALLAPYLDRPGDSGQPLCTPEQLGRLVARLDRERFQVHVHAIGDRAIRMTLDAVEAAARDNGRRDARHTMAHIELFDPADVARFRALGVIADFQPLWAWADPYITELTEPALGPRRSRWLYPIGSLARSGAVVAAGSDWSVSSMNPLEAIQVAITRCGLESPGCPGWLPEQRVDLPAILAAYTINGAYAAHQEKLTGSIETGKAADLIVLDRNLFEIPADRIASARVLLTLLDGREVFRDPSLR